MIVIAKNVAKGIREYVDHTGPAEGRRRHYDAYAKAIARSVGTVPTGVHMKIDTGGVLVVTPGPSEARVNSRKRRRTPAVAPSSALDVCD